MANPDKDTIIAEIEKVLELWGETPKDHVIELETFESRFKELIKAYLLKDK